MWVFTNISASKMPAQWLGQRKGHMLGARKGVGPPSLWEGGGLGGKRPFHPHPLSILWSWPGPCFNLFPMSWLKRL